MARQFVRSVLCSTPTSSRNGCGNSRQSRSSAIGAVVTPRASRTKPVIALVLAAPGVTVTDVPRAFVVTPTLGLPPAPPA